MKTVQLCALAVGKIILAVGRASAASSCAPSSASVTSSRREPRRQTIAIVRKLRLVKPYEEAPLKFVPFSHVLSIITIRLKSARCRLNLPSRMNETRLYNM